MDANLTKPRMKFYFIISFSLLICACQQDTEHNPIKDKIVYAKGSLFTASNEGSFTMIYDLDPASNTLAFRAIPLKKKDIDPAKDAVNAFLNENHFSAKTNQLKFEMRNSKDFSFSGSIQFKDEREEDIFWKAMDITIARHHQSTDYSIDRQGVRNL